MTKFSDYMTPVGVELLYQSIVQLAGLDTGTALDAGDQPMYQLILAARKVCDREDYFLPHLRAAGQT